MKGWRLVLPAVACERVTFVHPSRERALGEVGFAIGRCSSFRTGAVGTERRWSNDAMADEWADLPIQGRLSRHSATGRHGRPLSCRVEGRRFFTGT